MRKLLSFLLTVFMVTSVIMLFPVTVAAIDPEAWDGTVATAFAGGDGTAENPYQIATAGQLAYMSKFINEDSTAANASKSYKLTADIVLNEGKASDWEATVPANKFDPIGYNKNFTPSEEAEEASVRANVFKGTFDGNGHTISGMYVSEDRTIAPFKYLGVGMFAFVRGATIKNFALLNSYISSNDAIGAIVGYFSNAEDPITFENIYSDAIVTYGTYAVGKDGIGGLIGNGKDNSTETISDIRNCVFAGSVKGGQYAGGILGNQNALKLNISNCLNCGTVEGTKNKAGIVGRANNSKLTVTGCVNIGTITGSGTKAQLVFNNNAQSKNPVSNCFYLTGGGDGTSNTTNTNVTEKALTDLIGTDVSSEITSVLTDWTTRENDIIVPTTIQTMFAPNILAEELGTEYTITWKNYDGKVLAEEKYKGTQIPKYNGETPVKADDDKYTYTFACWTPTVVSVTEDATYTAEFFKTRKTSGDTDTEPADTQDTATTAPQVTTEASTTGNNGGKGCGSVVGSGSIVLAAVLVGVAIIGKKIADCKMQ